MTYDGSRKPKLYHLTITISGLLTMATHYSEISSHPCQCAQERQGFTHHTCCGDMCTLKEVPAVRLRNSAPERPNPSVQNKGMTRSKGHLTEKKFMCAHARRDWRSAFRNVQAQRPLFTLRLNAPTHHSLNLHTGPI